MNETEDFVDENINGDEPIEDSDPVQDTAYDDEFEYDEDGNIIISDVIDGDEAEEIDDNVEVPTTEVPQLPEKEEPSHAAVDEKDTRITQLEDELLKLKAQGKETLSKLGVKNDDVMEGLISLAAEADGTTPQDYLQKKASEERDAKARALLQAQEFEKLATADLAELHAAYPETRQYHHVRDLPEEIKKNFGKYRDLGLSAKAAYAAANPDGIRSNVASAVQKQSLRESKSHLRTAVPKGAKDDGITMPRSELASWRDLFPNMSDKEINELYKKTAK